MANYRNLGIAYAPFVAGVDFSTCGQWQAIAPGSVAGEVVLAVGPSGNPWPLGILQNTPCSGQEAQVQVIGFSKMKCRANACGLAWGRWLQCASDGVGEPLQTEALSAAYAHGGSPVFARYMDSGTVLAGGGSVIAQVQIFHKIEGACGKMGAS